MLSAAVARIFTDNETEQICFTTNVNIEVSPLTIAWSMGAAASLMLAIMLAVLWLMERRNTVYVVATLMALGATFNAICELFMMFSTDIPTYALLLKLDNLAIFVMAVSLVWFVHLYFRTGLLWMVVTITAMWSVSIVINFAQPFSIVFSEITELVPVETYWGETFSIAKGQNSPWVNIPNLASLLILFFLIYSSVRAWRKGRKRRAMVVGGGSVVFILLGGIHAPLVDAGLVQTPYMVGFAFLAIVAGMSYELLSEAILAGRYAKEIDASERRWKSLLDTVPVYVAGLDRNGRIDYANPLLCKVSGFTSDELSKVHFTDLLEEGERERGKHVFAEALRHAGSPQTRMSLLTKDRSRRQVVWSTGLVTDSEGRTVGMLSIGTDVTDRVRAQAELQRTQREMDRLTRATLLGEVAAGLAHELNQPLTAILSNAQAARRMLASDVPPLAEVGEIVEDIIADDKRAGDVIHGLRSLLRSGESARQAVNINEAIRSVAELLGGELHAQHFALDLELASGLPEVEADPVQMQQVVMNFLLNAMKAMKDMPDDQRRIVVQSFAADDQVSVSVIDRGPGIDPALLPVLFDAFVTSRSTGLGMGLAICRRIVEVHGGLISAENNRDGGASFSFSLPVDADNMAVPTA
jgi:PAS domain S-box-containing protein